MTVDDWRPQADAGDPATQPGTAREGTAPRDVPQELDALRGRIEDIDDRIIALLAERIRLAHQVGAAKRSAGLPALDPPREAAVVRRAGTQARAAGMEDEDVRYIFWHIIAMTRRAQMEES
jgi:chorismate mutase